MAEDSSEEADDEGPSTSYFKRIPARHVCPHCPKAFKFPNKLRNHLANFHSAAHKCVKCSEAFDTHSQLRAHWSKVHPKKHQCEQCDFSAKRPNELRRHVERSHSSEHGVPCPIRGCSAIFSYAKLKRHLTLAHCEESAVEVSRVASKKSRLPLLCCEHCDFETNEGTSVFQEHLDRMHGAGVVCPVEGCLERVSLKDLLSHLQSHGEPAISTSESPKKTVDISGLLTPTWTTDTDSHAESDRELDEGSEDGQDQETDSHAAIPGTSDALVCSICGKRSSNGRNLRRHVQRVHERAYAEKKPRPLLDCPRENCEKKFKCQSLLDDHVATHDGTIRFSCENCSKKFSSRALFAVHLKKYHLSSIKDYRAARRLA